MSRCIGLAVVERRNQHAHVGAEQAAAFLRQHQLFESYEVEAIAEAIRAHSSIVGGGVLGAILRDADMLDVFGAVGIMRCFSAQYATPTYPEAAVKGDTWGFRADDFTARFQAGRGAGSYAVDYLNFHLSCVDNLQTVTAKRIAEPLVAYMQTFLLQLEAEGLQARNGTHGASESQTIYTSSYPT